MLCLLLIAKNYSGQLSMGQYLVFFNEYLFLKTYILRTNMFVCRWEATDGVEIVKQKITPVRAGRYDQKWYHNKNDHISWYR